MHLNINLNQIKVLNYIENWTILACVLIRSSAFSYEVVLSHEN